MAKKSIDKYLQDQANKPEQNPIVEDHQQNNLRLGQDNFF